MVFLIFTKLQKRNAVNHKFSDISSKRRHAQCFRRVLTGRLMRSENQVGPWVSRGIFRFLADILRRDLEKDPLEAMMPSLFGSIPWNGTTAFSWQGKPKTCSVKTVVEVKDMCHEVPDLSDIIGYLPFFFWRPSLWMRVRKNKLKKGNLPLEKIRTVKGGLTPNTKFNFISSDSSPQLLSWWSILPFSPPFPSLSLSLPLK